MFATNSFNVLYISIKLIASSVYLLIYFVTKNKNSKWNYVNIFFLVVFYAFMKSCYYSFNSKSIKHNKKKYVYIICNIISFRDFLFFVTKYIKRYTELAISLIEI